MKKSILFKVTSLALVATMLLSGCGGGGGETTTAAEADTTTAIAGETEADVADSDIKIGMVTDVGGVNDLSFNQSAWEGLQRLNAEFGVKVDYLESKQDADYIPHMETFIDSETSLIWGVGFKMADALKEQAEAYPDQLFAIIDNAYDPQVDNIVGVMFKNNEASFLAGLVAGKMTKTNKVGMVTGMDFDLMNQFKVGYYAGVKLANPDAEIVNQYSESFTDPTKGKAIAIQMYQDNCDIVHAAAGDTGNGVIEAAKENNKWAIGVDRDQNDQAPDHVLTSAMKRVDVAMYDVSKQMVEGTLVGGQTVTYGTENGGVDIAPSSAKNVPQDVIDYVEEVKAQIISGEVVVPATMDELIALYPEAANY